MELSSVPNHVKKCNAFKVLASKMREDQGAKNEDDGKPAAADQVATETTFDAAAAMVIPAKAVSMPAATTFDAAAAMVIPAKAAPTETADVLVAAKTDMVVAALEAGAADNETAEATAAGAAAYTAAYNAAIASARGLTTVVVTTQHEIEIRKRYMSRPMKMCVSELDQILDLNNISTTTNLKAADKKTVASIVWMAMTQTQWEKVMGSTLS
jgi:hypothetical protein